MKKIFYRSAELFGMILVLSAELPAKSFLGKISSMVIIFTVLAGSAIWMYAAKKRKDLEE